MGGDGTRHPEMRFGCGCIPITPQNSISGWSDYPEGGNCSIVGGLLLTRVGFFVAPPPQYVGSFAVEDLDLQQQAGRLEEQLRALKVWHPLLPLTGKWGDPK